MYWSTACPDWQDRILSGRSLIPFPPLYPQEAEQALEVFNSLTIVDAAGRPTFAEAARPWVTDFVAAIFGAYDAEDGVRRIQNFMMLIAKKNGKSTLAAAIMVTALLRNWRESGEFYILAPTKEIADNSYLPARDMVKAHPVISTILKPSAGRVIEHRNTGAFLKVIAADNETVTGKKTIGLLVDELHVFGQRSNSESMLLEATGGLASRPEGFVIYLSTMSDRPPAGVFSQKLEEFRQIRDGKINVPNSLGVLYEHPPKLLKDDTYLAPEYWGVTNPNLGVSVFPDFLSSKLAEAQRGGRASLNNFVAKHFNVQISQSMRADGWAAAEIWGLGKDSSLSLDAILERSEVVTVGVDGGGSDDLFGVAVIGREKETGRWLAWAHALVSTVGVERRKGNAEDYARFKREGSLTVFRFRAASGAASDDDPAVAALVEGADSADETRPRDVRFVMDLVQRIRDKGLLAQVGVDTWGIGSVVDGLESIGVNSESGELVGVYQGRALAGAIKTIERMLADGRFLHGGQQLLSWCVGNLRIVPTETSIRVARDEAGFGKIDPLMALINAAFLMSNNPEAKGSIYTADRGLVVFG